MFFALSKILYFLIRPVNWLLLLLLIAWRTKSAVWKKRMILASLILLIAGTNRALLDLVAGWWELPPTPMENLNAPYDIGILLGGYSNPFGFPDDGRHHFNASANRFTQALELYHQKKINKILITGGWGKLMSQELSNEAQSTRDHLISMGIPATDILIETRSRNTRENATFTKILLDDLPGAERCLLITSAWHMRRSLACFRKAGLPLDPYCVDYMRSQNRPWWETVFKLDPEVLQKWESLIKEWVGMVAYRAAGYI